MTVIRTIHNRENPYVQLNKEALWDERLSMKAIGLWARCMSRPDNWKFNVAELASKFQEGRKAIDSAIHELIENGYALRIEYWDREEDGKFCNKGYEYIFFEFKPSEEEKAAILEEFKKSFRYCRYGNLRYGNLRKGELLISSSSKKINKEETNPAAAPPGPRPPKKPKKIREDLVDRVDRVQTTSSQHASLIQKLGSEERVREAYVRLSEWKIGKGIGFTSGDYQRICNWVIDALREKALRPPAFQATLPAQPREPEYVRADYTSTVSLALLQREKDKLKKQVKPNSGVE